MRKFISWASAAVAILLLITFWGFAQEVDVTPGWRQNTLRSAEKKIQPKRQSKPVSVPWSTARKKIRGLPKLTDGTKTKAESRPVAKNAVKLVAAQSDETDEQVDFAQQFSQAYDSIETEPVKEAVKEAVEEIEEPSDQNEILEANSEFADDNSFEPVNVPDVPELSVLPEVPGAENGYDEHENTEFEPPQANPSESVEESVSVESDFEGDDFVPTEKFAPELLENSNSYSEIVEADPSLTEVPNDRGLGDLFWWKELVNKPLNESNQVETTDTNTLVYNALKNSPRIQAISKDPLIRELQVAEAEAEFDPVSFLNSQFDDRNDPVGNTLTTGGAPFLEDHIWSGEVGFRRKLYTGADVELGQRMGFQNSNSRFFVPQDQGTSTLSLNFTQPLLRGRGRFYNQSQILIAQSAGGVAWEGFKAELQQELESVVEAYWQLYFERSVYLQKKKNIGRGQTILELLEGRSELDSLPSQIARAKSAVLSRKTELVNAFNEVRNSETEVRRLIADPNWLANQNVELVPLEQALKTEFDIPLSQIVQTSLENRPEIKESLERAKIAAIQYDVSTNELLPDLSLLLSGYISALEGDTGIELALSRQFENTPGYSVGFEFEFPIYNRAARSRRAQRKVQKAKIASEVDEIMQNVIAEAQVAFRRLTTAHQTMDAAKVAIDAAHADLVQNQQRWESFALVEGDLADGQTPTTVLDQLLDSQDRLTAAEFVYSQAELELKIAEVGLRRVMGTLLQQEQVSFGRYYEDDAPNMTMERGDEAISYVPPTHETQSYVLEEQVTEPQTQPYQEAPSQIQPYQEAPSQIEQQLEAPPTPDSSIRRPTRYYPLGTSSSG